MTLSAQIKTDAELFVNAIEFGEKITFVDPASPREINALIDPSFDVALQSLVDTRQSIVILSHASKGIADPKPGDKFLIRGRSCRCEDVILSSEDGMHDLIVEVQPP
ncbi:MAG: hypothetical protein V3U03_17520 [Myxococcota bacterium]